MAPFVRALVAPAVVTAVLLLVRPGVVINSLRSPVAWLAVAGIYLAGWLARWSVRRSGGSAVAQQVAGTALVVALAVGLLAPSFRQRTLVEDFPEVAATGPVATSAASPVASAGAPTAPTAAATAPSPAVAPSAAAPASVGGSAATPAAAPRPAAPPSSAAPRPSSAAAAPTRAAGAQRLTAGSLEGIGHSARGRTALYLVDGRGVVRFEDVDIEGTVDPSVHLVPRGKRTPGGGIRLGALKAEKGSFSYQLPAGTDLARDWTVLVWCDPYDTPIGASDHS